MAGDAFPHQDAEPSVPPMEDPGQVGTPVGGVAGVAGNQQSAKGVLDGLTKPVSHLVGVAGTDSEGFGELGSI